MDSSTVDKYQQRQVPLINNRGVKKVNLRQTYPRKRDIGRESSSMDTIKVAVDKIGPLVYAVQNGLLIITLLTKGRACPFIDIYKELIN